MSYQELSTDTVCRYIGETAALSSRYLNIENLTVTEIGDGNLNFVYLIREKDRPEADLIIKQAVPYCRCMGQDFALGKERMFYEIRSLKHFSRYSPRHIPDIIWADEEMALVAMQYLGEHITARKALIAGQELPKMVDHLTSFMAEVLYKTSSMCLTSHEKRDLIQQFNTNKDLCKITEDFVFTLPYTENEHKLLTEPVKQKILALKYKFMNNTEALLHGDMHTGSMMVNRNDTYVIDSEFAFFGPIGFDVGLLMANYIFAWARHVADDNMAYASQLSEDIQQIWRQFDAKFLERWQAEQDSALGAGLFMSADSLAEYKALTLLGILRDSLGFACCEILRRLLGVAKVEDIESIEDPALYRRTKEGLIKLATALLMEYEQFTRVEQLAPYLKLEA